MQGFKGWVVSQKLPTSFSVINKKMYAHIYYRKKLIEKCSDNAFRLAIADLLGGDRLVDTIGYADGFYFKKNADFVTSYYKLVGLIWSRLRLYKKK